MSPVKNVSVTQAAELIADGAFVLDVREPDEWSAGHVADSTSLPLAHVPNHLDGLPRDRLLVCVCRSGARSGRAAALLAEEGFSVVNVEGGLLAWAADDQALVADGPDPRVI